MIRLTSGARIARALAVLLCLAISPLALGQDQEEHERSKRDAVERVVESHDTGGDPPIDSIVKP